MLPTGEDGTLWNEALLDEAPESNRQLSRNRYDHDPLDASALSVGPLQKPSGDCAFWLMLDPQPRGLDHRHPHGAASGSRDALRALYRTAVVGARCKAEKARHLSPVRIRPGKAALRSWG